MKIRTGFVSNSSSSSFIISKDYLTKDQIKLIHNHIAHDKQHQLAETDWDSEYADLNFPWEISEDKVDGCIYGYVFMDNFDMKLFLEKIGVPMEKVSWGGYYGQPEVPEVIE
jgi:hypothetical protein